MYTKTVTCPTAESCIMTCTFFSCTHPFYCGVHGDTNIAVPLRRHYPGRMSGSGVGGSRGFYLARGYRGQPLVGHLVYARLPRGEPVQRRSRRFVGFFPRQFLPARRVDLRIVVRDVRFDAHGFCCEKKTNKQNEENTVRIPTTSVLCVYSRLRAFKFNESVAVVNSLTSCSWTGMSAPSADSTAGTWTHADMCRRCVRCDRSGVRVLWCRST